MIDFKDFDDIISDEMLAAYIDGNATMEENELIKNASFSNEILMEAQEVANDINSLVTDEELNNIADSFFVAENQIDIPDGTSMAAAILEPSNIDSDIFFPNIAALDDEPQNQSDDIDWNIDNFDL